MKNLLSLSQLNKQDVSRIFEVASQMRSITQSAYKKNPQLSGRVIGGVWDNPCSSSTAFALATSYLGGTFVPTYNVENSLEQCVSLDNMGANMVVVSCENDNLVTTFASAAHCAVINGGSNRYDPIGVLSDLFALYIKLDGLQNLTVLLVGNKNTNKVDELTKILQLFNSSVVWYLPQDDLSTQRRGIVLEKIESAFSGVDAVLDLGLTAYSDPTKYYGANGGISSELMAKAGINATLLGTRNVVNNGCLQKYENNAVDLRDNCYVSIVMAILYLINQEK